MKQLFFIMMFIFTNLLIAQKSIKISYEQIIFYPDTFFNQLPEEDREGFRAVLAIPTSFELINNGDYSLFKSVDLKEQIIPSKELSTATSINKGTIVKPFKVWILKDFMKQSSISYAEVSDKDYYTEEPFSNETVYYDTKRKVIDGYNCMSAYTISKSNDTIQYWYTQDIPVIDSPFSMSTIPGLVLCIESKKKVVYVTKIEFFDKILGIEKINKKFPLVNEEDLNKIKQEALKPKSFKDENGEKHSTNSVYIKN